MKTYFNRYNILFWLIIILLIINVSAITTIFLGIRIKDRKDIKQFPPKIEYHRHHEGRLFDRSLNLTEEQRQHFRKAKHKFYSEAKKIAGQMHKKRVEFLNELASDDPDTIKLQEIAEEIGSLHTKLKYQTYKHYLDMKSICTNEQEEKLIKIFKSMLYKEDSFMSPRDSNLRRSRRPPHHREIEFK
jgi:Spy/CpxP family protein refolding chaperone